MPRDDKAMKGILPYLSLRQPQKLLVSSVKKLSVARSEESTSWLFGLHRAATECAKSQKSAKSHGRGSPVCTHVTPLLPSLLIIVLSIFGVALDTRCAMSGSNGASCACGRT